MPRNSDVRRNCQRSWANRRQDHRHPNIISPAPSAERGIASRRSHVPTPQEGQPQMRTSAKLVLTALTAAVVLASAISTASARNLSVSEQSFRATWAELEFSGGIITITCRVTLEGSFHTRTIAKVRGSLIGAISRAIVAHPCTSGEAWMDNGTEAEPLSTAPQKLPFHLTYEGFRGTLPAIETIRLLLSRVSFVIQTSVFTIPCRARYGRAEDNIIGNVTRNTTTGEVTTLIPDTAANRVSRVEALLGSVCPETGAFAGTGNIAGLTAGRITVTLI